MLNPHMNGGKGTPTPRELPTPKPAGIIVSLPNGGIQYKINSFQYYFYCSGSRMICITSKKIVPITSKATKYASFFTRMIINSVLMNEFCDFFPLLYDLILFTPFTFFLFIRVFE